MRSRQRRGGIHGERRPQRPNRGCLTEAFEGGRVDEGADRAAAEEDEEEGSDHFREHFLGEAGGGGGVGGIFRFGSGFFRRRGVSRGGFHVVGE